MPEKISYAELMRKLNDPNLSIEEIEQYFKAVPNQGQPFCPRFEINTDNVDLSGLRDTEEGVFFDVSVGILNRTHMRLRRRAYEERIRRGWKGLRFLAEGDSWFKYPLRNNDYLIDFPAQPFAIGEVGK